MNTLVSTAFMKLVPRVALAAEVQRPFLDHCLKRFPRRSARFRRPLLDRLDGQAHAALFRERQCLIRSEYAVNECRRYLSCHAPIPGGSETEAHRHLSGFLLPTVYRPNLR